jgi:hypothetical protein
MACACKIAQILHRESLTFNSIPDRLRARCTEGAHEKSLAALIALWYNALRLKNSSLPFLPT